MTAKEPIKANKFDVILADPPWSFRVWNNKNGTKKGPENHYPTMDIEAIRGIPVRDLARKNCALFLWAVWPSIPAALTVIKAWGFKYRTQGFTWVKLNKRGLGFFTGLGYYTRANTEPCLLAVRGNMPVAVHDVLSLIVSPVREHSQKPDEQYNKIERLYPGRHYLELFARSSRPGWVSLGNEVNQGIDIIEAIKSMS